MLENLNLVSQALFSYLNMIVVAIFSNGILLIFLALWVVRKISKLLDIIH